MKYTENAMTLPLPLITSRSKYAKKKKPRQREEIVLHDRQTLSLIKNDRSDLCQAVCAVLTFVVITTNEYSFAIDICLKYQT